jgi:hypothetical protein
MWDLKGAEFNIRFLKDTTQLIIIKTQLIIKTQHNTTTQNLNTKKKKIDKKEKKQ